MPYDESLLDAKRTAVIQVVLSPSHEDFKMIEETYINSLITERKKKKHCKPRNVFPKCRYRVQTFLQSHCPLQPSIRMSNDGMCPKLSSWPWPSQPVLPVAFPISYNGGSTLRGSIPPQPPHFETTWYLFYSPHPILQNILNPITSHHY